MLKFGISTCSALPENRPNGQYKVHTACSSSNHNPSPNALLLIMCSSLRGYASGYLVWSYEWNVFI